MRLHLGFIGLALGFLASGLTACAAQTSISAGQLIALTATATLPPAATHTSTVVTIARVPTRTPSQTPLPTATATEAPPPDEPAAVLTPVPIEPPASDGVLRTAHVPILMYHYISASPSAQDRLRYGLSVPPEMFEAQLKLLHDNGFTTITLRQLYEHLAVGAPLPEKPIVLTLDDGYVDNYTNAFPILQKYGMIGTFFVLTAPADDGDLTYLTWDMIQEMSRAGMDIQLHARDHLDMRHRPYDWLVFQIIGGRQSIEGHTGQPVIFMAYPSGKYDASVQRFLRDTHFWAAVTTVSGSHHVLREALNWDRVRISGQMRLSDFARLLGINVMTQHATLQPSATPTATRRSPHPVDSPTPTRARPTQGWSPPSSATPSRTPTGPLLTATSAPSPLITPTSAQSPLTTPTP